MSFGILFTQLQHRRDQMHTLKLEINDTIFDKVMFFLNNLPKNDVKLTIESNTTSKPKKLNSISIKTKDYRFDREEANAR